VPHLKIKSMFPMTWSKPTAVF